MEMISLSDIERAEFNEQLVIVSQSEEDVLTDDFDLDKKVNYHLVAPTDAWLRERFLYGSSCKE